MIRRLIVSNFRSFGANVGFDLGRLTALVGPNGSGKSNAAGRRTAPSCSISSILRPSGS